MILIIERDDIAQIAQLSALLRANLDQGAKLMQQMDDLKKAQADIAAAIQGAAIVMQSAADKLSGVSQQPSIDPADVEAVAQSLEVGAQALNSATAGLQGAVSAQPSPAPAPGTPAEVIPAPAPADASTAPAAQAGVPAPGSVGVIGG